jgi:hypothetical protein
MHCHFEQVHTRFVLRVEPRHVRERIRGPDHHSDAVRGAALVE